MSQRKHPIRAYLSLDLYQWVSGETRRRGCSISHLVRVLVAEAKEADTLKANAVTGDHSVLTEEGWKQVSEIGEGDRIALWNPETQMIELHPIRWDRMISIGEPEEGPDRAPPA